MVDNLPIIEMPDWYRKKSGEAPHLPDTGGYNLYVGEMNPCILDAFFERLNGPKTLWEPFAGHTRPNWTVEYCEKAGHRLIAYDIHPCDERVVKADSTLTGPPESIGGVIFHPPYFTTDPMSGESGEIAVCATLRDYLAAVEAVVVVASAVLESGGIVCSVNRSVHLFTEWINVNWNVVDIFLRRGFRLFSGIAIVKSTPDVIVFLEKF